MTTELNIGDRVELNPEPDEPINDFRVKEVEECGDVRLVNVFNGQEYLISSIHVKGAISKKMELGTELLKGEHNDEKGTC